MAHRKDGEADKVADARANDDVQQDLEQLA
jgi:hypothetical protein